MTPQQIEALLSALERIANSVERIDSVLASLLGETEHGRTVVDVRVNE